MEFIKNLDPIRLQNFHIRTPLPRSAVIESGCWIYKSITQKVIDRLNSNSQERCISTRGTFVLILIAEILVLKELWYVVQRPFNPAE